MFLLKLLITKKNTGIITNIFLSFSSVVLTLFIVEMFLQISTLKMTYMEKVNHEYVSPYIPQDQFHYHIWLQNKDHWLTKPEYSYLRHTNSLGLPDKEWPLEKKSGEKRILFLGDSFTEGDGAAYDSSYVAFLQKNSELETANWLFMNGGVCGSDPFYNYVLLKDKLLNYKPDIIIQTLSTNDITTDILLRGGMERFKEDGSVKFRKAPWWEPIYAMSYFSRLFFNWAGYNDLLVQNKPDNHEVDRLNEEVISLFKSYSALCVEKNIKLIVILRPDKSELISKKYNFDFSKIEAAFLSDVQMAFYDLMPEYQNLIAEHKTSPDIYFWKQDGHHNAKGYALMAEAVWQNIRPMFVEPDTSESPSKK